jgi:hypothetical protein
MHVAGQLLDTSNPAMPRGQSGVAASEYVGAQRAPFHLVAG